MEIDIEITFIYRGPTNKSILIYFINFLPIFPLVFICSKTQYRFEGVFLNFEVLNAKFAIFIIFLNQCKKLQVAKKEELKLISGVFGLDINLFF